ncbi:MAG: spermidine synthase [Betaproteobacteria bacterium]|jgi:spermidine synthase|nr:spermidine synthase [Betaproteobacteria bacterium]
MSRGAFYLLFTASGFAGLIYESLWTHYLKLFLGHAAYAQSLVLVVFMGGMAGGAALCARWSSRLANPLAVYAAVEAAVGVLALVFHVVFVALTDWSYGSLLPRVGGDGASLAAKLFLSCLLILPQSVLLGATFPLMSAGIARALPGRAGESVAMLYFTNSLGAAVGVLASAFVLIGWLGLPGTLRAAGVLNLVIAGAVFLLSRPLPALAPERGAAGAGTLLLAAAFFTGVASFIYEIVWIRMLSLVLGASTHSFELMLATFILGLALGGLAVRRRVDASPQPARLLGWVQVAMGLAALATLPVYDFTFGLMEALMRGLAHNDAGYALFNLAGGGIAAMVMLPATFCAGMTLPLITGALLRNGFGEAAVGRVYAANTFGAIAGVVFAVHVGLPVLGIKGALIVACLVDALLGLVLLGAFGSRTMSLRAGAVCAAAFVAVAAGVQLDANKMTAGVFRHSTLEISRDAQVLYARDGKTATVHLVKYQDNALSLRTNGKSDGSINLERSADRGSDEITMVLTGALPLALRPDAKSVAVIGIGTGLTTHTLLQSLAIERVDTVEIEAAMVEASRGFLPRNRGAYADPRGNIVIDDAKTFFAAGKRRYDVIISEPSNPWVSGVSSLFTREFYRRVREHLAEGGLLVQWFQLYEIDASLVASVLVALGEEFPHYSVYAASDHDLLIVASLSPLPAAADPRVFEQPALANELWTVHVMTAGDLDARYVGSRATLEPLFASYGMPANSDYAPVLDQNAARHRFTDRNAAGIVELLNAGVPLLELLERDRSNRPVNPLFRGAEQFARVENTRLAWYARNFLAASPPEPRAIPTWLQKDLEILRARLVECRQPRELDVWLHSALRVAQATNPYLSPNDLNALWPAFMVSRCYGTLTGLQRRWLALFRAVGARDAAAMGALGEELLASQQELSNEAREYLLTVALAGHVANAEPSRAVALWDAQKNEIRNTAGAPGYRLLRCHAERERCAAEFRAYADR